MTRINRETVADLRTLWRKGMGRGSGASLIHGLELGSIRAIVGSGRNDVPGFASVCSAAELDDVAHYVVDELASD